MLLEIVEKVGGVFDAIIVDEGQDFLESWWFPLLMLLKDSGSLHVYYDTRQQLWGPPRDLPQEVTLDAQVLNLTENVRNTKPIHDVTMRFHPSRGEGFKALIGMGTEPEFVPILTGETEPQAVRRVLEALTTQERVPLSDIAVLTPLSLVEQEFQM